MSVILVTGAAKRIGREMCLHFAKQGWDVIAHYHTSVDQAKALRLEIKNLGQKCWLVQADLSDEIQVRSLIQNAIDQASGIDILVNNAATFAYDSIATMDRQSWDYHIEPNLRAPMLLIQEFARLCKQGLVVNILDQRVLNLTPHYLSYSISKYALWGATQSLALALAPDIRINGIGPGPTLKNDRQTDQQFERQYKELPLAKPISPQEIAETVEYFWKSPSVTGQIIAVDGGQHLGWAMPPSKSARYD
ncbi:MAG: SDR family oxidoreductase [Candidatus Paracaedibacteraceae bacterium]|nr:SDR family oxidoreductase [Candidatus Paracaedibacteraceae bacterium]